MDDYHIKHLGHRGDGITEEGDHFAPALPCPKNAFLQMQRENRFCNVKILDPLNIVSNFSLPAF